MEVWLEPRGVRRAGHSLLRPWRSHSLKRLVVVARGLPDVFAAEPWAAELGKDIVARDQHALATDASGDLGLTTGDREPDPLEELEGRTTEDGRGHCRHAG